MNKIYTKTIITGASVSIVGAFLVLISGYGYQWGWWGLGVAFRYLLFGGSILGLAGLVVALFGMLSGTMLPSGKILALGTAGIILGAASLTTMTYWYQQAQKYPPIHDITTDTENPPEFDAIVPLRKDAPNKTEYAGEETASIQKEHYPDIAPLYLDLSYEETFDIALDAARSTSWRIVDSSREEGRIEATHELAWYGFKDDVVIRVDTAESRDGSRIDVRSVSRIGRGDVGVNAQRIRSYLDRVKNSIE
ncbi:MAG: DUF1499 domain-containing protein [Balneolaceae bacterium]|nr:DUF1499 domain-containing protein [Balneolaceae bacterium]